MKTLINKSNPQIKISAPEIERRKAMFYQDEHYCLIIKGLPWLDADDWTLVEEEPMDLEKAAESYSENRTGGIILDDEVKAFKAGAEWQKKQPITFNCIGKQVTMTVQQLIDYYIDTECADVADECGF